MIVLVGRGRWAPIRAWFAGAPLSARRELVGRGTSGNDWRLTAAAYFCLFYRAAAESGKQVGSRNLRRRPRMRKALTLF